MMGFVLYLVIAVCGAVSAQTPQQVKTLVSNLLSNYDKRVRPVDDQTLPVILDVSFNLISIIGVDEVNEKLETSGFLTIQWSDAILKWNPATNNGISKIFLPQNDIWKPDLVLGNGFKKFEELGGYFYYADITSFGDVYWKPFQVFQTHCAIDTMYFPYDEQVCEIVFVVWSYTVQDVEIFKSRDGIDLLDYKESGVWEITYTEAKVSKSSAESKVTFLVHIKRKPLYYVLNIIAPILFLGILTILVFVLPVDAGEKMSYAMTVFLSFAVFLTIISAQLPVSSDSTPVLTIYLLLQMTMGVMVLVITALQIRLHHRDETVPMSRVFVIMVKLDRCLRCSKPCRPSKHLMISPTPEKENRSNNNHETRGEEIEKEKTVEWREVTSAIDLLAFWIFLILYLVLTTYLFLSIAT